MANELHNLTIHEARGLLDKREVSSVELTRAYLDRIQAVDPRVRSYITVTSEQALEQADDADKRIAAGETTPLTGIPLQITDNMCTRGVPTPCASRILDEFVPPDNATAVPRLPAPRAAPPVPRPGQGPTPPTDAVHFQANAPLHRRI